MREKSNNDDDGKQTNRKQKTISFALTRFKKHSMQN